MKTIVINQIRFAGTYGGAIFDGTCADGESHRLVADYRVMPRAPVVGECWRVEGRIQNHHLYGRQVVVTKAILERPSGRLLRDLIAKSKDFPGIGEKSADYLWRRFGEGLYAMLDAGDPATFEGPLRSKELARTLVEGWRDLVLLSAAYQWLDRHGAPVWLAQKIVAIYRDDIVAKLEENPYRLLAFTNWKLADGIARSMGVGLEDERRLVAAADAAVVRRLEAKHTWGSEAEFRRMVRQLLGCSGPVAARAVELAIQDHALVRVADGLQGLGPASMEEFIACQVMNMAAGDFRAAQLSLELVADEPFLTGFFADYHGRSHLQLNQAQRDAVKMALNEPVSVLCGGAGVGKTTVLKAVCGAAERLGFQVFMMALSGRAARRMAEATGRPAMTIASFVNRVDREAVVLDAEPLIVIDEASMLDLATTYRLLRRLEPGCRLLLIGDPGQLPPISFGVVFHTLVAAGVLPMVELTEVHRQAAATGIPQVTRSIREGVVPQLAAYRGQEVGIQFVKCSRDEIPDLLVDVVADLGGFEEARILSPVKNGAGGTRDTNLLFHQLHGVRREAAFEGFAVGEPVIWTENNYELELMNGSLGVVVAADDGLVVDWDGEQKRIDNPKDMDYAYAITVHKAQGSQFRRVIIPVFDCQILDRTMLYTALTRAEEQVVVIGDRQAFEKAIREPPSTSLRQTGLEVALHKAFSASVAA